MCAMVIPWYHQGSFNKLWLDDLCIFKCPPAKDKISEGHTINFVFLYCFSTHEGLRITPVYNTDAGCQDYGLVLRFAGVDVNSLAVPCWWHSTV